MSQRGNIDYDQIRSAARLGTGLQVQMSGQAAILSAAITSGATSFVVTANPASTPSTPFTAEFDDGTGEQVQVTGVASTTWTVTRGFNSTSAAAHSLGAVLHIIPASGNALVFDAAGNAVDGGGAPFSNPLTTKGDLLVYGSGAARLPVGSDGQALIARSGASDGVDWESQPYDVVCSFVGQPGAGATVLILTFTRAVAFPGNFSGSKGTVGTNPTATAAYAVLKNGSSIGSVSISTAGAFTFSSTGGAAQSYAAGDRMTVTAPATQDATLADVGITLAGTR